MKIISAFLAMFAAIAAQAHPAHENDRAVSFPDTADGTMILTVDLHTHSVFSDGRVWPSICVEEAARDGLDAMAITEHLEYQRHADDIPNPDRNRSYRVAQEEVEKAGIDDVLLINGAEITRDMPPGHTNAVFLSDANALLTDDFEDAFRAANEQGAFVFWNHPNWTTQSPDAVAQITSMHKRLIRDGKLHGIEVANGTLDAYSEHALGIALKYKLTILGTSDIHGLVDWTHNVGQGGHRPMTLVLSREKSKLAIRQALFDGHTVAWHNDDLIGREENVREVVQACLNVEADSYQSESTVLDAYLVNRCPTAFILRNEGKRTFQNASDVIVVPCNAGVPLHVRMEEERRELKLEFTVLSTQVKPRQHLELVLRLPLTFEPRLDDHDPD